MNRILVAFLASLACVALTANASELFVEPATLASSADRLDSFLGLGEEPEDKDAAPASDAALDVNGKPVFNGTQKVGQDAGEIETLPDPPKENKTKAEPRMVAVSASVAGRSRSCCCGLGTRTSGWARCPTRRRSH